MGNLKYSLQEIEDLVTSFSNATLLKNKWTHEAHLMVALWYNSKFNFDEAITIVKEKIKSYNVAVGAVNTEKSGYHETLTIFWMIVTKSFFLQNSYLDLEEMVNKFLQSESASRDYPMQYYTKDFLFSKSARKRWVNGNRSKLPLQDTGCLLGDHWDLTDKQFMSMFNNCELSPDFFNHEAHLRHAWINLRHFGLLKAKENIDQQLRNFVRSAGVENKYHVTLTLAAVEIVNHFLRQSNSKEFYDFILEFPRLKSDFKALVTCHYSIDIFKSEKAKNQYVEPDIKPFPKSIANKHIDE